MIDETSKLGIAMDLIEYKIASIIVEKRNCTNEQELKALEEKLQKAELEKKQIYSGNIEYINKIIEEKRK